MYKDKPLIIAKRPFWRHPVFPWGWYSLVQDDMRGDDFTADGYYSPNDSGGSTFIWVEDSTLPEDDGVIAVVDSEKGRWINPSRMKWFGAKVHEDNPDLPTEFINDALKATEEIEAGETESYIRRDKT